MSDHKLCQFCGKEIPFDSLFCPHCGGSQEKPIAPPVPESKPQSSTVIPPQQSYPTTPTPSTKNNKIFVIIGIVIVGIILLTCAGLVFLYMFT